MAGNSNSSAEITTQQALRWEYAIMLGAQPLGTLAALINWTNASSHQRPTLEPWGHIATRNSPDPSTLAASEKSSSTPSAPEVTTEVAAPSVMATPQAAEPELELAIAAPVVPPTVVPEPVTVNPPQPKPEAVIQEPGVAKPIATKPIATKPIATKPTVAEQVVAEAVVEEAVVAVPVAEVVAEIVIKEEAKHVLPQELAPIDKAKPLEPEQVASLGRHSELVEPGMIQAEEPVQPRITPKPISKSKLEPSPNVAPRSPKPASSNDSAKSPDPELIKPPPKVSPVILPAVPPQQLAASSMPEWRPTAKISRPSDSSTRGDEYLRQLERLIIELNMELGMREGESPSQETDPMSLLVQRMIDVNLQNLALKEQLREAGNPTL